MSHSPEAVSKAIIYSVRIGPRDAIEHGAEKTKVCSELAVPSVTMGIAA